MQTNYIETPESNNKYIKCKNCKKDILSSKMFLHEGFCIRNNIICPKCEKVVLKKEYQTHINNHLNPYPKKALEKSDEENNNPNILSNKKNYYPYIKINAPIEDQETIKVNNPIIIISTGENELKSPKEYEEYFLRNYKKATLLNTNIINDNESNNENIFQGNEKSNIIIGEENYKYNNYIIKNRNSVKFVNEFNNIKNNSKKEPLDRESRFSKLSKSYNQEINSSTKIPQSNFRDRTKQYNYFNGKFNSNNIGMMTYKRRREKPIDSSISYYEQ